MKKTMISLISAVALLAGSSVVYAEGTSDPGVNARQHVQKHRIKEGMRSGELTARESKRLYSQQKKVNRLERAYKSDGDLTAQERKNLHKAQNKTSQNIYQQKHDDQTR